MSKLKNINDLYTNLIANNADFRAFVESMEKYSTDEIIAMYELENDVISNLLHALSNMQP